MAALKTASVYQSGKPTYLRFSQFTKERIVIVDCYGVTNPGSFLNLAWSQDSGPSAMLPKPGVKVKVHNLVEGVLHIVSGEIVDVSSGSKPRIRVRVEENCIAVQLRKHTRHLVLGKVRLGQEGDINSYNQTTPHEMDVSLGGFGLTAPDSGYKQGDEIGFCLDLLCSAAIPLSDEDVFFQVSGRATIRRAAKMESGESVQLGLEFLNLVEESKLSLGHWLTVHDSTQRQS